MSGIDLQSKVLSLGLREIVFRLRPEYEESGNPGGRPKVAAEVLELARHHGSYVGMHLSSLFLLPYGGVSSSMGK